MASLAGTILDDCRAAVGEVRFGFGSKRQVWAFEERHRLDVVAISEELASTDAAAFLDMAVSFHEEFAAVSNAWRVRDWIQGRIAGLCATGDERFLARAAAALLDERLAVRHWLLAAFASGPPPAVFKALQDALARVYVPQDQWALLSRLEPMARTHGWVFAPETAGVLASLAQFSPRPDDRRWALTLLATCCGPAGVPALRRAAQADADPAVRAHASQLAMREPHPT